MTPRAVLALLVACASGLLPACGVAPREFCDSAEPSLCGTLCVDHNTNAVHCGDCSNNCGALPGVDPARVRCVAGACVIDGACRPGRAHCANAPAGGCETDLTTTADCGRCGNRCTAGPDMPGCVSGRCVVARCRSGYADCDGVAANGCETPTDAPANCGACRVTCRAPANGSPVCRSGACDFQCDPGFHRCGGACVSDASTDSCGPTSCAPCPAVPNGTATCNGASCGVTCNPGFHACGAACASNTSVSTCGTACAPCVAPTNGTATCDGTRCGVACSPGFHACGATCASNLSPATCGTSCTPCMSAANATATCNGTSCDVACNAGFADCDGAAATGCEVDTRGFQTDPAHCGGCGRRCPADATCQAGRCISCHALPATVALHPLDQARAGDDEFDGNCDGPVVRVEVRFSRTPTQVTVEAVARATENRAASMSFTPSYGEHRRTVATLSVLNLRVETPDFVAEYVDDCASPCDDAIAMAARPAPGGRALARSAAVTGVACIGDTGGADLCTLSTSFSGQCAPSNRTCPGGFCDCSGCTLALGQVCVERPSL